MAKMSLPASALPARQHLDLGKKATVPPTQRETASVGSVTQCFSVRVVDHSGYLPDLDTIFASSSDTLVAPHKRGALHDQAPDDTAAPGRSHTAPGRDPP